MRKAIVGLINFYQTYLSFDKGLLAVFAPGGACKNNPSCSEYAKQMVGSFGILKGSWLGLKRIWRCR